jgi:hypothetical protein
VSLDRPVALLWSSVEVYIPIMTRYPLMPLNAVTPTNPGMAQVSLLVATGMQQKIISIGKTRWEQIEVMSWLYFASQVVISPTINYDPAVHVIKATITK